MGKTLYLSRYGENSLSLDLNNMGKLSISFNMWRTLYLFQYSENSLSLSQYGENSLSLSICGKLSISPNMGKTLSLSKYRETLYVSQYGENSRSFYTILTFAQGFRILQWFRNNRWQISRKSIPHIWQGCLAQARRTLTECTLKMSPVPERSRTTRLYFVHFEAQAR